MNRKIIITVVAIVVAMGLFFGYRSYKASADRELARQRAEAQMALIREHEADLARRNAALVEARRMAEERAKDELARQEEMRKEQEAAQAALEAAQADLARLNAERDRMAAEKDAASADAARMAAERDRASAAAEAARVAALQKIHDLEARRIAADRETARRAALLHQQELEAEAQRLALERERNAYEVGGYLVRDFSSLYILKDNKPTPPSATPSTTVPPK
ncbi:MAG: hypothetical protein JWM35_710 [Verrucomicrobia bacterium]|nr:hypothetical protein [Verrucomicrobiota bacterium]